MKKTAYTVRALLLTSLMVVFVSCGGQRPETLKDIKVSTETVDGDIYLNLNADLDFGNIVFPSFSIPVIDPKTNDEVGTVALLPVAGGLTQLSIDANISVLADINPESVSLPNGGLVPFIANNPAVKIDLGNGAQLYLTASQDVYAIGVALPISGLDSIGSGVGMPINFFPVFTIDEAISTVGLFTSPNAGENGLAFVSDVSAYVPSQEEEAFTKSTLAFAVQRQEEQVELDYNEQIPKRSIENYINNRLLKMHWRKTRLRR